jgi:3'(2'), 5'-bisphosphate nucleotidase
MIINNNQLQSIIEIAQEAAGEVNRIYQGDKVEVEFKDDNSPLTVADKKSNEIIVGGLQNLFPDIPIISEESKEIDYRQRKQWPYFWLVDPLDGTKEFINKNGEFTINIALIKQRQPLFGLVAVPQSEIIYYGQRGVGSFQLVKEGKTSLQVPEVSGQVTFVRTRSHPNPFEDKIISLFKNPKIISAGSALKFCRLAQGCADIYLRGGPTMEWDTAAGQAVAEFAGASTFTLVGEPFLYNKQNLKNSGFVCLRPQPVLVDKLKAAGINIDV